MIEPKYKIKENILILLGELPNKAGGLWVECDSDLSESCTNKTFTNFIVGQREYILPIEWGDKNIIRVWID